MVILYSIHIVYTKIKIGNRKKKKQKKSVHLHSPKMKTSAMITWVNVQTHSFYRTHKCLTFVFYFCICPNHCRHVCHGLSYTGCVFYLFIWFFIFTQYLLINYYYQWNSWAFSFSSVLSFLFYWLHQCHCNFFVSPPPSSSSLSMLNSIFFSNSKCVTERNVPGISNVDSIKSSIECNCMCLGVHLFSIWSRKRSTPFERICSKVRSKKNPYTY